MSVLIKNVRNLHLVTFDQGSFDEWCVYLQRNGQRKYAPTDVDYFDFFKKMGLRFGNERVYKDFCSIYNLTDYTVNPKVLNLITQISDTYGNDAIEMDIWLSVIYGGMVAEENKKNMKLKKRIKRLGMYQLLIEGLPSAIAAHYSRGKKWKELDVLMHKYEF